MLGGMQPVTKVTPPAFDLSYHFGRDLIVAGGKFLPRKMSAILLESRIITDFVLPLDVE